jgi:hypothetical protein
MKLGLEARIKKEVVHEPILEWMIPQAADVINRFLVGTDGRTARYRVHLENFNAKTFEFGEQVLAKPKRSNKAIRKKGRTLDASFHDATWVGYNTRSSEHIVVLKDGRPAIEVRTVKTKAESERWNAEAIEQVAATPDIPNPKDDAQRDLRSERNARGLDFGARGGRKLAEPRVQPEPGLKRNFRISDRLMEKYGATDGCEGCRAKASGDEYRAAHSAACRTRFEEAMAQYEVEMEILDSRDASRSRTTSSGPTRWRRTRDRSPTRCATRPKRR